MQPAARFLSQAARQTFSSSACSSTCGLGLASCQLPKTFVTVGLCGLCIAFVEKVTQYVVPKNYWLQAVPAAERLVGACVLERLPVRYFGRPC